MKHVEIGVAIGATSLVVAYAILFFGFKMNEQVEDKALSSINFAHIAKSRSELVETLKGMEPGYVALVAYVGDDGDVHALSEADVRCLSTEPLVRGEAGAKLGYFSGPVCTTPGGCQIYPEYPATRWVTRFIDSLSTVPKNCEQVPDQCYMACRGEDPRKVFYISTPGGCPVVTTSAPSEVHP